MNWSVLLELPWSLYWWAEVLGYGFVLLMIPVLLGLHWWCARAERRNK